MHSQLPQLSTLRRLLPMLAMVALVAPPAALAAHRSSSFCVLAVEETGGSLAILAPTGPLRARIALGERPHELVVSPDRRTVWVSMFGIADYDDRIGTPGATIAVIDLATARHVRDIILPADVRGPHGLALRPPGHRELFVNTEAGPPAMLVFDSLTGVLLRRFPLPDGTHHFAFSRDGAALFGFAGAKGVSKLDARTGALLARGAGADAPVRGIAVARDGMVIASTKGALLMLDPGDLHVTHRLAAPRAGQFMYPAQWPDGTIFSGSLADGGVAIFPPRGPARFVTTGNTPIHTARGPDGRAYVGNVLDHHISVLSPTGAPLHTIGGLDGANGIGFGRCPRR